MNRKLILGFATAVILAGGAGYSGAARTVDPLQPSRIATSAYVLAVCGPRLASCEGVIVERASSEGRREYHVLNGAVYWRSMSEGIPVTPETTQPTVLGMACTGIPVDEFDDTGEPGLDPLRDTCEFHRREPLEIN